MNELPQLSVEAAGVPVDKPENELIKYRIDVCLA